MPLSYVEDITAAWLEAAGVVVHRNVWLQQQGSRRSWTDVDVLASDGERVVICSCKAFIGDDKADVIAEKTAAWFAEAEALLLADPRHRPLFARARQVVRILVVDDTGTGTERIPPAVEALPNIRVVLLRDVFVDLARHVVARWRRMNPGRKGSFWLRDTTFSWGKTEDTATRLVMFLLRWGLLDEKAVGSTEQPTFPGLVQSSLPTRRSCSSCGSSRDLNLVAVAYSSESAGGRLLLYCPECRARKPADQRVNVPLDVVTPDLFISLYEKGMTESAPETASEIVFGEVLPHLVTLANEAMRRRSRPTATAALA